MGKRVIVDIHNHPDWHGHAFDKFLANMKQYNIDVTWLLSWESPEDEYHPDVNCVVPPGEPGGPIPFSRCLSYVERAPAKFVLGYAPDPRRPEAIDKLQAGIELYGVKVYGELKVRMMYDNLDALRMFRFCGEKKIPVIVHIDYELGGAGTRYPRPNWWYGGGIEPFERAIQKCPGTVFIGHGPGFWAHISKDEQYQKAYYPEGKIMPGGKLIKMLRQYSNLYCDLSAGSGLRALQRDKKITKDFLLEFQNRILYGRDYFDNCHQEFLNKVGLPEKTLAKIYSGNALRLVPVKVNGKI